MSGMGWKIQAEAHWKEHRPKFYAELNASGQLQQKLQQAADLTYAEMDQMTEAGLSGEEAFIAVRGNYLFPPGEDQTTA